MMKRRDFLKLSATSALLAAARSLPVYAQPKAGPKILLRSSWQVVNIGDIAHTPGVLALLEKYIPDAQVTLWASADLSPEVIAMEHKRFPKLTVVKGSIGSNGKANNDELAKAVEQADFLLHGSGASFVAYKDVVAFVKATGKPYGVYGITYSGSDQAEQQFMGKAKFIFFRDSVSLGHAKDQGIQCPIMEFGPDGAFGCDLRNDDAATSFMKDHGLEEGKFVCCIPRLRYTPYWLIKKGRAFDAKHDARNQEMKEHDHAPLRAAITEVARKTPMKVLLCPEDQTQMAVHKEMILDKLPDDVKPKIIWRENYWLTDEALSTYVRSAGLFGLEMHSPIMCIGNDVPAIVCRFAEQTSKGLMWRDIGLNDWLFDFDQEEEIAKLTPTVLAMINDRAGAMDKTEKARAFVQKRQKETMGVLAQALKA
jgi:polysaccharide pyruvyl transferase WcaK-like protein